MYSQNQRKKLGVQVMKNFNIPLENQSPPLSFFENLLIKYGFTDKTLKATCLFLENIPFDKKKNLISSSINKDGSIMSISFIRDDAIRLTFSYNQNGKSTIVSTLPNGHKELSLVTTRENVNLGNHYIISQLRIFFKNNPDIMITH